MPLAQPQDSNIDMAEPTAVRLEECNNAAYIHWAAIGGRGGQPAVAR